MRAGAITLGLRSARFCYVPSDYYDRELEARRVLLGASSTDLLCKTVIVENRKWEAVKAQGPVTDATTASARGRFFANAAVCCLTAWPRQLYLDEGWTVLPQPERIGARHGHDSHCVPVHCQVDARGRAEVVLDLAAEVDKLRIAGVVVRLITKVKGEKVVRIRAKL